MVSESTIEMLCPLFFWFFPSLKLMRSIEFKLLKYLASGPRENVILSDHTRSKSLLYFSLSIAYHAGTA